MQVSEKKINLKNDAISAAGIAAGATVGMYFPAKRFALCLTPISESSIESRRFKFLKKYHEIDSFENILKFAQSIISRNPDLGNKKYLISILTPEKLANQRPLLIPESFLNKLKIISYMNIKKMTANGINAFLMGKTININDKSLYSAVFHEIGHALRDSKKSLSYRFNRKALHLIPLSLSPIGIGCFIVGMSHKKSLLRKI